MVAARHLTEPFDRHPLARESMVALAAVGALGLWVTLVVAFVEDYVPIGAIDVPGGAGAGLALRAFVTSVFVIAGMVLFVGVYARYREIEITPTLPDRQVLGYSAAAIAASFALVGFVALVATLSESSLAAVTGTTYGPETTFSLSVLVIALGLFIGIPAYVLVSHVLLQCTIRRAGRPMAAIAITTIVVGVLGPTAVLNLSPIRGVIGFVLVAGAIALPVIAMETYDRRWLVAVTAVPGALLVAGVFAERVSDLAGAAGVAHLIAVLGFVAVGAYAYERTGSVLPSALAYATFTVAMEFVLFATQVGIPF